MQTRLDSTYYICRGAKEQDPINGLSNRQGQADLFVCEQADSGQDEERVPGIDQGLDVLRQGDDQSHAAPQEATVLQAKHKLARPVDRGPKLGQLFLLFFSNSVSMQVMLIWMYRAAAGSTQIGFSAADHISLL